MYKFKSLGIIALCALSFTFMSFSSSSDELYDAYYYSNIENTTQSELEESAWIGAAARLVGAASRHAVRYTREVARVSSPYVQEALRQAFLPGYAEAYSAELYEAEISSLKNQQIRSLN
jgi:hypothetical protein